MATAPNVDLAKIDATTRADIANEMRQDDYDPDEPLRQEDIISPAVIRKRFGLSQRRSCEVLNVPLATLRNWEQNRTPMDPSARALGYQAAA